MSEVKQDLTSLKLTVDTETNRNIVIIAEGHLDLSRQFHVVTKASAENEMLALKVNTFMNEMRQVKAKLDVNDLTFTIRHRLTYNQIQ